MSWPSTWSMSNIVPRGTAQRNCARWTEDESLTLVRALAAGKSLEDVALAHGRTYGGVTSQAIHLLRISVVDVGYRPTVAVLQPAAQRELARHYVGRVTRFSPKRPAVSNELILLAPLT